MVVGFGKRLCCAAGEVVCVLECAAYSVGRVSFLKTTGVNIVKWLVLAGQWGVWGGGLGGLGGTVHHRLRYAGKTWHETRQNRKVVI